MRRILIINAKGIPDIIRAGQLVKQYELDGKLTGRSGRLHFAYYTAPDDTNFEDGVAVWHSAIQITVRFKD